MVDLVLKGKILDTKESSYNGFIAINEGLIVEIGKENPPKSKVTMDHGEDYLLPGAIDAQVHSRSQLDQEGFGLSTQSAAAGGVTTIVDMPYDAAGLIYTAQALKDKCEDAGSKAVVDFAFYGTIPSDGDTSNIANLVEEGVIGFKFSSFGTDPDRFPRIAPHHMYKAMCEIAPTGLLVGVHNENHEVVVEMSKIIREKGLTDYASHTLARPKYAENIAITEVYELGVAAHCPTHIVHCSNTRGYEICSSYQQQGHQTTIEACLHYLFLNEEDTLSKIGGMAKVNPPIRERKEMEGLWEKLKEGAITIVSTDHVSWSADRKTKPNMFDNSSGIPGLEVLYPLMVKGCLERGIPLQKAVELLAEGPAKLFNITEHKGSIAIGKHADITVMGEQPYVYDASESGLNAVDWSPYQGMKLPYKVKKTYVRGNLVYDGKIKVKPGFGNFVKPIIK